MNEHKIVLRAEQVRLLENVAVLFESSGLQPASAKVLGLLLVNDNPELTFDEIRATLGISKSGTSVVINQLMLTNKIKYKTHIGDRKRYFSSRVMSWSEGVNNDIKSITRMSSLFRQILDQRPDDTQEFNMKLKKLIDFLEFLNTEMAGLLEKFEESYS